MNNIYLLPNRLDKDQILFSKLNITNQYIFDNAYTTLMPDRKEEYYLCNNKLRKECNLLEMSVG